MRVQDLKEKLSIADIRELLVKHMGATISFEDDSMWISDTVCHGGTKQKLYFYKDSSSFHCYTECGQMDIISLVIKYNDFNDNDIQKAISWIVKKLNIDTMKYGFGQSEMIDDWDFILAYRKKKKIQKKNLKIYDKKVLNSFQKFYRQEWIDEGISIESMMKYNILYNTCNQQIIIPHYNGNNDLIGIRVRNMIEEDIDNYGKYMPYRLGNKFFNHALGSNLYGINKNKDAIARKRKIMIVESEKSVLQTDTMFGEDNFTVALCGCNLSNEQRDIILSMGVIEVIIALDKQYEGVYSKEYNKWIEHLKNKIIDKLTPFVTVTVLLDTTGMLGYKDSPTDRGKDTLLQLMDNKIYVGTNEGDINEV